MAPSVFAAAFFNGQLGSRLTYWMGRFGVDLTGKLALGVAHQALSREGASSITGVGQAPGPLPLPVPGGFYVLGSNAGRTTSDRFAVLPEVGVRAHYQLSHSVSLTAG